MKPAKCTQCGDSIIVDETKEAGICPSCGTAFVTEKVINNYVNNYNTVHNITENVTKIIMGNEKDEAPDFFKRGLTLLKLDNLASSHQRILPRGGTVSGKSRILVLLRGYRKKDAFQQIHEQFLQACRRRRNKKI